MGIKKVIVTGATGAAGPALVRELVEKGHTVRIFSRRPCGGNDFPPGVESFQGDILDPAAVKKALDGVDAVFHLAAMLHDTSGETAAEVYHRVNVEATRRLVEAARSAGVKRFIFYSTINVYGPSVTGHAFDEYAPPHPGDAYAASKREAEKIVLQAGHHPSDDFSVTVLRVAAVYGTRMKGNYNRLIAYLKRGGCLLPGSGDNIRTLIFDTDLARGARLAMESPRAKNEIYNITDGTAHTFKEIVQSIAGVLGRRVVFMKIPASLMGHLILLRKRVRLPGVLRKIIASMEKQMESVCVSSCKIEKELGFIARTDLFTGWRRVIAPGDSGISDPSKKQGS